MRNEQLSKVERRQVLEFGLSIAGMDAHLAWDRLIKMLDGLGFRRCLYGFHPDVSRSRSTGEIIDIMTTMSSYDDAFMEMYWAHKKPFTSAVAGYVIMNEAPTLMGPFIGATLATPSLPTVFRDWLEDYNRRTHVFDGVVVPLRGPVFSARGAFPSWSIPRPIPTPRAPMRCATWRWSRNWSTPFTRISSSRPSCPAKCA